MSDEVDEHGDAGGYPWHVSAIEVRKKARRDGTAFYDLAAKERRRPNVYLEWLTFMSRLGVEFTVLAAMLVACVFFYNQGKSFRGNLPTVLVGAPSNR